MLYINGNEIKLTRGDTAYLKVPIYTNNGEEYVMSGDDALVITVKKEVNGELAFQRTTVGNNTLHITPRDTSVLAFGVYVYDVQLNKGDGDVFTVIPVSTFEVLQEVTV
jgi:hypothetical protein